MAAKFPFIDASFAAELLDVQTADILQWIAEGKLTAFGGKERNPFVRTAQVEALARELGREVKQPSTKRRAADNPVRRVELRLRHDARWNDVSEADIEAWVRDSDQPSRGAARQVAEATLAKLRRLLEALEKSR